MPTAMIQALGGDGIDIETKAQGAVFTDIDIELSAGFESSVASFSVYNVFDSEMGEYQVDDLLKVIAIGTPIKIMLGYGNFLRTVFVGVINRVTFAFEHPDLPYVRVSAMDIKGVMMANNYSKQLKADNWSDAVTEIFQGSIYEELKNSGAIGKISVEQTEDKKKAARGGGDKKNPPPNIEMVSESDYEFVVKAAKKNNFEFFVLNGDIIFRPCKVDKNVLMTLAPYNLLRDFEIEYDVAGQVSSIEVRATDHEKGELISSKTTIANAWSTGSKAKTLVKGNEKVVLDSTVHSKEEADIRVASLVEASSYAYGKLNCEILGTPDFVPGRYVAIGGIGAPATNFFYLTSVRHWLTREGEYRVFLKGVTAQLES